MKRTAWMIASCLALSLAVTPLATAGQDVGDNLLTISGGGAFAWSEATQEFVGGWAATGSFDRVGSQYMVGLWAGVFEIQASGGGSDPYEASFSSIPILANIKYVFGDPQGKVVGYVGGGIGLHFSKFKGLSSTLEPDESRVGLVFGVPLGANFYVSDSVLLNAQLNVLWMSNTAYQSNIANVLTVGIGFKLGN